jgi:hypothetical protein
MLTIIQRNEVSLKKRTSRVNIVQKAFLFFAIFCFSATNLFAQDVITLKSGEDIQALVQEIGDTDVKYKKFDNPNGPNYTLKKSEIFMIRYANGSKDVFTTEVTSPMITGQSKNQQQMEMPLEPLSIDGVQIFNSNGRKLSKSEIQNLMRNVPDALDLYNSGAKKKGIATGFAIPGNILCWGGLGVMIAGIANEDEEVTGAGLGLMVASLPFNIVSMVLSSSGNARIRNSVGAYNSGIRQRQTSDVSLNFGVTQSGGVGLTLKF